MLRVQNISTGYGKKQVLFDVSFEVSKAEIVMLAGSNGSGKSTLLKAIYGILPQRDHGKIFFDGLDITGKPASALLKMGLLYIPQKNNLFEDLTLKENLEMAGLSLDHKLKQKRIEDVLSIFTALVPHLNQTAMKLSGGERQMLTLAMANLHRPKMILVDEPLTGLSSKNLILVMENLKKLHDISDTTLLIVEHRVKECLTISNKVIGLKLGKVFCEIEVNRNFNVNQLNTLFI